MTYGPKYPKEYVFRSGGDIQDPSELERFIEQAYGGPGIYDTGLKEYLKDTTEMSYNYFKSMKVGSIYLNGDELLLINDKKNKCYSLCKYFINDVGAERLRSLSVMRIIPTNLVDGMSYHNPHEVKLIETREESRGLGYATMLYISMVMSGYTLVADKFQFEYDRATWKTLSRPDRSVRVDVIDTQTKTKVKMNKIITDIFDPEVWVFNIDKLGKSYVGDNIRLVLRKVE